MTLQAQLASVISAIGADIKQLKNSPSAGAAQETTPDPESTHRLYPDADYVCRLTETYYPSNKLKSRSWLETVIDGQYTTRTEALFAKDGSHLLRLNFYNLNYYPGTSVLKGEILSSTKSIADSPRNTLFNDLIRIKSQTPLEVWTSYTQWGDNSVFNGTSSEIGMSALPVAEGVQYIEYFFDSANTAHAAFGLALGSFNIDQDTLGGANLDSIVYNTQTGELRYGGSVFASASAPAGVTNCTYSVKLNVSNNQLTVYHTQGGVTATMLNITCPMVLNGAYFVFTGASQFTRTKFRVNYGEFDWDYADGALGTFGATATFK